MTETKNVASRFSSGVLQAIDRIRKSLGDQMAPPRTRLPRGCERQFDRRARILSTTLHRAAPTLGLVGILACATAAQGGERTHTLSFFPSMSDPFLDGIARIINHSGEAGEIRINALDDEGEFYGPLVLSIAAAATIHLTSDDLETGNAAIGLSGSLPPGQGDWRLRLSSELEIEVLAYVRTADGFLTAVHDTVPSEGMGRRVAIFNPSNDDGQVSSLRLTNTGDEAAEVSIVGIDDDGASPGSEVKTTIPAGASRMLTASVLEAGGEGLEGSLGDGAGMWQLIVESAQPIVAMNLLSAPAGQLTNLSTSPPNATDSVHLVPLLPTASDALGRQGFVRVINLSDAAGQVTIQAYDGTSREFEALTLALAANQAVQFDSDDLEYGNTDKGLSGSTGAGQGDWRLELTSGLDTKVLAYVRSADGVVEAMHDVVSVRDRQYRVATFNPGNDGEPRSLLWLANSGDEAADVTVTGIDDTGDSPSTEVRVMVPSGESKTLTAQELEAGGDGLEGALGNGEGRWRLTVESVHPIIVMSLLSDPTGHLANLSTAPGLGTGPGARGHPDLVAESPAVSDSAALAGAQFTLSATARNGGEGTSPAATLRYYRSTNRTISSSDAPVGTDDVEALAASGSSAESAALTAPATAGTYYYGACVDAVEEESETRNNCSRSVQVTVSTEADEPGTEGQPNLVVWLPSVSNSGPAAGTRFALSATVRNDGDAPSAATTLRYYRSANATISAFDTGVGRVALVPLAASGSVADSVDVTAPATVSTYYYGACVAAVAGESDTAKNCSAAVQVNVQEASSQGNPDLTVSPVSVATGSSSTPPGGSFTISATVRNDGEGVSAATTLRYFRSVNATVTTSDSASGAADIAELSASESTGESMELTAPSMPGTYYYGACVDSMANESDATNNCSAAVRVDIQETEPETQSGPDLAVGSPTVSDSSPEDTGPFTLSVTVSNEGNGESAAATLRYYRSTDSTITTTDAQVGTDAVPALGAAGNSARSVTLTAPASAGTYYYGACVDSVDDESDTTDNCSASVAVEVEGPPPGPDAEMGTPRLSDSNPETGGRLVVTVAVTNIGSAELVRSQLHFYQSTDATISSADTKISTSGVGELYPLRSAYYSQHLRAPASPGTYYYGACIDPVDNESDTTNNCASSEEVRVGETVEALPDLTVSAQRNHAAEWLGKPVNLAVSVHNQGGEDSPVTPVRYYHSEDATITPSDSQQGGTNLLVNAGRTKILTMRFAAPSQTGTYYYGACVDPVPDESDTSNNCSAAIELTVEPWPENLTVSAELRDTVVEAGIHFGLWAEVHNPNAVESPLINLRFYRSEDATITRSDSELETVRTFVVFPNGAEILRVFQAPDQAGTYYYGACIEFAERESDTTDNCSAGVQIDIEEPKPERGPDLVVGSPTVGDSSPEASGPFTLFVTVSNEGSEESAATTLRYYRSTNSTITRADTQVGTDAVPALGASGNSARSVTLTAPASAGTYYYGACVDAVGHESDPTNNCSSSVEVTVLGSQGIPELGVWMTQHPTAVGQGERFTLSAGVANTGDGESAATTLRYYRSTDSTITRADTQVGTDAVPALGASGNSARSVTLTAPASAGTYYYGACVDAVEHESDTTNNCSSSVEVTVRGSQGIPELGVSTTLFPTVVGPGERFTLSAGVANTGDGESAATTLRYYRSTDSTITTADTALGTDAVGVLAPFGPGGDWITLSPEVSLDAPSAPGTYYYGACVDAVEGESDTANNCSTADELTVDARPADLTVSTRLQHHAVVGPGETVTLNSTVRNRGVAASLATTVRYFHSSDATITQLDDELGEDSGFLVEGGATKRTSFRFPAPSQPGTYYYGACVDAVEDESDTSNNCSAAVGLTVEPRRDVVTLSVRLPNSVLSPGDTVTLEAVLHNPSDAESVVMNLRFYRSVDATITRSDHELGEFAHFVVLPGDGHTQTHSNYSPAPSQPGTYYYGACLAPQAAQTDANTACSAARLTVVSRPD